MSRDNGADICSPSTFAIDAGPCRSTLILGNFFSVSLSCSLFCDFCQPYVPDEKVFQGLQRVSSCSCGGMDENLTQGNAAKGGAADVMELRLALCNQKLSP